MRAVFDGVVVAESQDIKFVEGRAYFPAEAVDMSRLIESPGRSLCFWKGRARYWHVQGPTDLSADAAFSYPKPWPLARRLVGGRIAFWRGVTLESEGT
jgi:uncharacterized protein (DUF427 family)